MVTKNKTVLFGLYDDETDLIRAIRKAKAAHIEIGEVYTPFPVHGLDPELDLKESRLHIAGFIYGAMGTLTAFLFMTWVFTRDWPIIFGGKPYWSVPAFIPITFELTVLFAAIGMVTTFYIICGMGPGANNPILHDRITDDKFCISFNVDDGHDHHDNGHDHHPVDVDKLKEFFKTTGATEVQTKVI